MSKIGKKPITLPAGVDVSVSDGFISVKGPKGTMKKPLPQDVEISTEGSQVKVRPLAGASKDSNVYWGLTRALVQNMIIGTTTGFEKVLEFQGVGYKATVKPARPDASGHSGGGTGLELGLGFSHPIIIEGAEGITFVTDKASIKIQGMDKELIGKVAADIRKHRLPEPYKGSGIRYQGEVIKRKAGKKAATAA